MDLNNAIKTYSSTHIKLKEVGEIAVSKKAPFKDNKQQAVQTLKRYMEESGNTCVPIYIPEAKTNMYLRLQRTTNTKRVNEDSLENFVNSLDGNKIDDCYQTLIKKNPGINPTIKQVLESYMYESIRKIHQTESTAFRLTGTCERGKKNVSIDVPKNIQTQAEDLYYAKTQISSIQNKVNIAKRKYICEQKSVEPFLMKHLGNMESQHKQQKVDINYKKEKQTLFLKKKNTLIKKPVTITKLKPVFASVLQANVDTCSFYTKEKAIQLMNSQSFRQTLLNVLKEKYNKLSNPTTIEYVSLDKGPVKKQ
jgi:hypothetical protein